jgi:hypothetical protein
MIIMPEILSQRQKPGNSTKVCSRELSLLVYFVFSPLDLIDTNATEKPVSTAWFNLMKKIKYGNVDSDINCRVLT